jgi:hypothetical protein
MRWDMDTCTCDGSIVKFVNCKVHKTSTEQSKPVDQSSVAVAPTNKPRKYTFRRRVPKAPADLAKLKRKLVATMERHSNYLFDKSATESLNKDETAAVPAYLRVIRDLEKVEAAAGNHMSEEELEQAAKAKPRGKK